MLITSAIIEINKLLAIGILFLIMSRQNKIIDEIIPNINGKKSFAITYVLLFAGIENSIFSNSDFISYPIEICESMSERKIEIKGIKIQ